MAVGCCSQVRAAHQHLDDGGKKLLSGGSSESLAPFTLSCYKTAKVQIKSPLRGNVPL